MTRLRTTFLLMGAVLATLVAGCARPGYFGNRARDAADVFTLTHGKGIGLKVRCGVVTFAPFYIENDSGGLRGGVVFRSGKGYPVPACHMIDDGGLLFTTGECFAMAGYYPHWFSSRTLRIAEARGKSFETIDSSIPFFCMPASTPRYGSPHRVYPAYYFTQAEVVLAPWWALRLGCNPGELLDLALGLATVDIFGDDLASDAECLTFPSGKADDGPDTPTDLEEDSETRHWHR